MRRHRLTVLLAVGAGVAAPAQSTAAAPDARLLVRQHFVAASTFRVAGKLDLAGFVADARWSYGSVYLLGDATVDAATGERLEANSDRLCLRAANGTTRWIVADDAVGTDTSGGPERRLLFAGRVVLPHSGGGLCGLDRSSGAVAWRRPDAPNALVVADGDCVAAAGPVAGSPVLVVLAVANGAAACRAPLPAPPQQIVPGPHGIAVRMAGRTVVFDRAGPQLFEQGGSFRDVVPGAEGWFALAGGRLESWSRTGAVRWRTEVPVPRFESQLLLGTPAGDVLVVTWMAMADSGFTVRCLAGGDGSERWAFRDDGLGVDHSKYWHRVQARLSGDRVYVVSQAAGGNFAVRFDPRDGSDLLRQKFGF